MRSKEIISSQQTIHPRLPDVVRRHLGEVWRQPLHPPSRAAFDSLNALVAKAGAPVVLDSGCGTGVSTRRLAERHPHCLVIGVDKSQERLSKAGATTFPHREGNVVFCRAELSTLWRLARASAWQLSHHYLLYPNPWPKAAHLRRRWHAHPVFPDLLQLGGRLELRCNWFVYAEEFALALDLALPETAPRPSVRLLDDQQAISPFEAKYRASGHPLYSLSTRLPSGVVKYSTPDRLL